MKSLSYGPEPYASANSAISANLSQQGKYPAKIYNILTFDFTQTWRDLNAKIYNILTFDFTQTWRDLNHTRLPLPP